MPHVLDTDVDDDDDFKHHIPTISPIGVKKPVPIKPAPFQPPPAPPVPFQAPPAPPTDNYMGDSDSESEDEYNKSDVDDLIESQLFNKTPKEIENFRIYMINLSQDSNATEVERANAKYALNYLNKRKLNGK